MDGWMTICCHQQWHHLINSCLILQIHTIDLLTAIIHLLLVAAPAKWQLTLADARMRQVLLEVLENQVLGLAAFFFFLQGRVFGKLIYQILSMCLDKAWNHTQWRWAWVNNELTFLIASWKNSLNRGITSIEWMTLFFGHC